MIGFGELRKRSLQWHVDIFEVERIYAIDWVIKSIFDHARLADTLILCGGSALRHAYCIDYPFADAPEFLATRTPDAQHLSDVLTGATATSGLKFSLIDFERGSAKVECIGPLGRRSAAQPRIMLSFISGQARRQPAHVPLLNRFNEACDATVTAIALEELIAERVTIIGASPRARDVFDLWFALTHARERIDQTDTQRLMRTIADEKHLALPRADALFNPAHRQILERVWDKAMRDTPNCPSLAQVEHDLAELFRYR